jgi:hypothetical protein
MHCLHNGFHLIFVSKATGRERFFKKHKGALPMKKMMLRALPRLQQQF